jgi:hypothetical protein
MRLKPIIVTVIVLATIAYPLKMAVDSVYAKDSAAVAANAGGESSQQNTNIAPATQVVNGRKFINNLAPNEYTPKDYVVPQYDPFNNQYRAEPDYKEAYPPMIQPNAKPDAQFTITNKQKGFPQGNTGTVGTKFVFNANGSSDSETSTGNLQARWDYESDSNWDSFFSTTKIVGHVYDKPGTYDVTLEVMDKGGAVSRISKKVVVVTNTPPSAYLTVKNAEGTSGTIFEFDTGKSTDSQYLESTLQYRFDWDNDGIWDTAYNAKTGWKHHFDKSGRYRVVMEAKDPEGLTSTYYRDVTVTDNNPPEARFTITKTERRDFGTQQTIYNFDASTSADTESQKKLQYRWDFNYTGPNDIVYDTPFNGTSKYTGSYGITGTKTIRLQVKDEDGATDEAYTQITVD